MRGRLMMCYLRGKMELTRRIKDFMSEEKGASDMVAVVVLIVIVVAAALIFREKIIDAVNKATDSLTDFVG